MPTFLLERHDVIGAGRGALIEMLRDRWGPHLEERFGLAPVGIWATVGSTGRWPEAWTLTRADDDEALAAAVDRMYPMEAHATYAYELWRHALRVRAGGASRVMQPTPGTDVSDRFDTAVCLFEEVRVRPGLEDEYRAARRDHLEPLQARQGHTLLAALEDAFDPHRVVNLWAAPDWADLRPPLTSADGGTAAAWAELADELIEESYGFLLAAAPTTRLGT